jgi:hypothetical protein
MSVIANAHERITDAVPIKFLTLCP